MKWRLREGDGEAVYEIGVEDNGVMSGLLRDELDSSLNTLRYMASRYSQFKPRSQSFLNENIQIIKLFAMPREDERVWRHYILNLVPFVGFMNFIICKI